MKRAFLASVFLLATATVAFSGGTETALPSSLASQPKAFWKAFMTAYYGPYSRAKKCWTSTHQGKAYCMRPHTWHPVSQNGQSRLFISVAGQSDPQEDCHACNGFITFYVLESGSDHIVIAAQSEPYMASGSWGSPVPEDQIAVSLMGADDAYGWVARSGYTGQGTTIEDYQIFGVVGDKVRDLGRLPKGYSDAGNCENGKHLMSGEACSDYAYELIFDTSKPGRFAPAILRASGTLKGEPFTSTVVAAFDETRFSYQVPKGTQGAYE